MKILHPAAAGAAALPGGGYRPSRSARPRFDCRPIDTRTHEFLVGLPVRL